MWMNNVYFICGLTRQNILDKVWRYCSVLFRETKPSSCLLFIIISPIQQVLFELSFCATGNMQIVVGEALLTCRESHIGSSCTP